MALSASAQVVDGALDWLDEADAPEAVAEWVDQLDALRQHPVNLNDTLALHRLPMLSPFQQQALRNYLLLNGSMLSEAELLFVPGFDSATVSALRPYVVFAPVDEHHSWRLRDGRHTLVAGLGGTVEQAQGYSNGHYAGDNLRALLCYTYSLGDHLSLRLVADKDPAEAWGHANFLSYHLMLSDVGRMERLIVGRYNVQFGQGLTLWSGLRPFDPLGAGTLRYAAGVKPSATFYETGYQEGVATRWRLGKGWRLSAFASRVQGEWLGGGHLEYRTGNLIVGLTASALRLDSLPSLRDYAYNQNRFRGQSLANAGIDWLYQAGRATLYGEAAIDSRGHPALTGGVQLHLADAHRIGLRGRFIDASYANLHAKPYVLATNAGERGLTLEAMHRLPLGISLVASIDAHRFTALRYGGYMPSSGLWARANVERQFGHVWSAAVRFTSRLKERNIPNLDTVLYLGEQTLRDQLTAEVRWALEPWSVVARGVYSSFATESGLRQRGLLGSLQARYAAGAWQLTLMGAVFDVQGYYARIYLNESCLQYAWSIPACDGRGVRANLVVRYAVSDALLLSARYVLTYMPGQEAIGSGDAATEGPLRQQWMMQVRCKF